MNLGTDTFPQVESLLDEFTRNRPGRSVALEVVSPDPWSTDRNRDVIRPGASTLKLLLVMTIYTMAERGMIALGDRVSVSALTPSRYVAILPGFDRDRELSLRELCMFSIITSDNSMSQHLFELMDRAVLDEVREAAGLRDEERLVAGFSDDLLGEPNRANALSCSGAIKLIKATRSQPIYADIFKAMSNNIRSYRIPALLDDEVECANKTGTLAGVVNDIAWIRHGSLEYYLAVMTDGEESNFNASNEIAQFSKKLYDALAGSK